MALIVAKFGGTSVGDLVRIKNVAKIVSDFVKKGDKIVVVVSAMTGVTNNIYENLLNISEKTRNLKEFDQAMVTGEQISTSLLAIALQELGYKAKSYNAQNLPIYGDGEYGDGYITYVNDVKLKEDLDNQIIPVIAGFQGFKKNDSSFITLGRGGSDYSAVMIAASLHADSCYIYTDVDGVYSADPRTVDNAIKIDELSYDEMIQIASDGAKVLQTKSVIAGKKYNISIEVLSSFDNHIKGTKIVHSAFLRKNHNMKIISCNSNLCLIKSFDCEKYDYCGVSQNRKKFYLVNSDLCYKKEKEIEVAKITVMSLDKNEELDLNCIKKTVEQNNLDLIYIEQLAKNRIVMVSEIFYKNKAVQLLHSLYYLW